MAETRQGKLETVEYLHKELRVYLLLNVAVLLFLFGLFWTISPKSVFSEADAGFRQVATILLASVVSCLVTAVIAAIKGLRPTMVSPEVLAYDFPEWALKEKTQCLNAATWGFTISLTELALILGARVLLVF